MQNNNAPGSGLVTRSEQGLAGGEAASSARCLSSDMRYEAYMALLDHRIRNAYVRTLLIATMHVELTCPCSSTQSIYQLQISLP